MELGVSVNGIRKSSNAAEEQRGGSPWNAWGGDGFGIEPVPEDTVYGIRTATTGIEKPDQHLGPCLYLGPAGERCYRPALDGGFCSKHDPNAVKSKISVPSRVAAASLGILGVLWPYVADLVKEIIRWMHAR
ncbi:MAG: hypothetical protein ACRD4S_16785 [Candidatus Acidiferrales bacterium]